MNKQTRFEGGFQGRTNKLVDSCYSFWQAGQFPIIHSILMEIESKSLKIFELISIFNFFFFFYSKMKKL